MLRLENIIKNYEVSGASFPALKGISLAFRKNEFVSILGPSGCGKTTLLNIIGGLDHYTSGDLIIEGKSTKQYNSHDWDVYRNYRIGFIFQSYNLIPHQNILENVELALTIAGYSKAEKRKKALNALAKVGLKNAWKKMPNQLSGGQCQRVAIARALVNEPDILLGDEPTGALDSKTSVQVMELIKKISKTKLVIMVTHNPELAKKYSSRIISLLDGEVVKDTNKYSLTDEKKEKHEEFKGIKVSAKSTQLAKPSEAKMSWWDAFKLSAKNLISKRKRTLMVIAASSIGIVGVSAVLAVSTGVKSYIGSMENDMLSGNPIRASETSLDLASAIGQLTNLVKAKAVSESWRDGKLEIEYLTQILIENAKSGSIIYNNLSPEYVRYVKAMPKEYSAEVFVDYGMDFSNNIYTVSKIAETDHSEETKKYAYSLSGLKNIYTAILGTLEVDGKSLISLSNLAANFPSMFYQGLDNNEYLKSQYDKLGGEWLSDSDTDDTECIIVLNRRKKMADLLLTLNGLLSEKEFTDAIWQFIEGKEAEIKPIDYSVLLNKEFYYIPNNIGEKSGAFEKTGKFLTPYHYNYRFEVDETNKELVSGDTHISLNDSAIRKIKIKGIIAPKEGKNYGSLTSGIYFRSPLANKALVDARNSDVYKTLEGRHQKEYTNAVFINKEGKCEAEHTNLGLTYELNFVNTAVRDAKKETDKEIHTYGTVGSPAFIQANVTDPYSEKEDIGIFISSSLSARDLAGIKVSQDPSTGVMSYTTEPYRLQIYTEDFGKKDQAIRYLNAWNDENITIIDPEKGPLPPPGKEGGRIKVSYTDNLTLIIAMINNLINTTTISLTVFASLALVVSTVMIGIITYISVMERIKEIGVIRALGGRKKDVRHLFNAETFILGGLGGLFGIVITYIFSFILDIVIYANFKIPYIAQLRWYTALIMIILSIVLTAISGIIPASSAAKKDPVTSLRTE